MLLLGPAFDDGSLTLAIDGTRDTLRFANGTAGVNRIEFADGTVWRAAEIAAAVQARPEPVGAPVTVPGSFGADVFETTPADEVFDGRAGGDSYRFTAGSGHDRVRENTSQATEDVLELPDIDLADVEMLRDPLNEFDLLLRFAGVDGSVTVEDQFFGIANYGVELFRFAGGAELTAAEIAVLTLPAATPGDDSLAGSALDDVPTGGTGQDTLAGAEGSDRYVWQRGDGETWIVEPDGSFGETDTLELHGVSPDALSFGRIHDGVALILADSATGAGDGGRIVLPGQLVAGAGNAGNKRIVFADDGSEIDAAGIAAAVQAAQATPFDDALTGGTGDDLLLGEDGDDTDAFARGHGHDRVRELGFSSDADRIEIAGYADDAVIFTRPGLDGPDLVIRFAGSDRVTLTAVLAGGGAGVDLVEFSDGTVWDTAAMRSAALGFAATPEDGQVRGCDGPDTLTKGAAAGTG